MFKICNRKILLFLLSFACIVSFLSFAFFSIDFKSVKAQDLVSELFVVDGVLLEESYNKGLKIDANQVDGNAKFKTNFYSDLSISFELLTSELFFIDILDEKNSDNAFSIFVERSTNSPSTFAHTAFLNNPSEIALATSPALTALSNSKLEPSLSVIFI